MAKRVLSVREETSQEKLLREWFEAQRLESPRNLEEAARLLVGLVTGLLGVLFSVLTLSAETLPAYISLPLVRWAGAAAVVLWLGALLSGLVVILPRPWRVNPGRPQSESNAFDSLLGRKAGWLTTAAVAFGLGTLALGLVLLAAIFQV
jgi:hypothetical protein